MRPEGAGHGGTSIASGVMEMLLPN